MDRQELIDPVSVARLSRLSLHARGLVEGSFTGKHKSPHKGASVEFAQYRKYAPGDDIGRLDWRVYARTDRFYIKEFEADTNLRCYLVLDCSGSMRFAGQGRPSKFACAARLAAHLAHVLIGQGDAVGLQCFADDIATDIPPRNNPKHFGTILDRLADTDPDGETRIVDVLHNVAERIRRRALVIVFSDFFTEVGPLLECFGHFRHRKHDLAVFHILDEEERGFQFERPIRFRDLESSHALITEPAVVRDDYLAAFDAYLEDVRAGCLEHGVDYREATTSSSCEDVLAGFMLNRMSK